MTPKPNKLKSVESRINQNSTPLNSQQTKRSSFIESANDLIEATPQTICDSAHRNALNYNPSDSNQHTTGIHTTPF